MGPSLVAEDTNTSVWREVDDSFFTPMQEASNEGAKL